MLYNGLVWIAKPKVQTACGLVGFSTQPTRQMRQCFINKHLVFFYFIRNFFKSVSAAAVNGFGGGILMVSRLFFNPLSLFKLSFATHACYSNQTSVYWTPVQYFSDGLTPCRTPAPNLLPPVSSFIRSTATASFLCACWPQRRA